MESYYKKCQERNVSSPYSNLAGILITGSQLNDSLHPLDWTGLLILFPLNFGYLLTLRCLPIGHFTVMDGSEAEGDLVLIQTLSALLWKLFLKNTSWHKNNLIYIIKQEGLYQNKVTFSLASIHNCKMAY